MLDELKFTCLNPALDYTLVHLTNGASESHFTHGCLVAELVKRGHSVGVVSTPM